LSRSMRFIVITLNHCAQPGKTEKKAHRLLKEDSRWALACAGRDYLAA
jgi:hypothetical protein